MQFDDLFKTNIKIEEIKDFGNDDRVMERIFVKELTLAEQTRMSEDIKQYKDKGDRAAVIMTYAMCDEDGVFLMGLEEIESIKLIPYSIAGCIQQLFSKLNASTQEDRKELVDAFAKK